MTLTPIGPVTNPLPSRMPRREPYLRIEWIDEITAAKGYLVVDKLVRGMATGGTRMRAGCTASEVADLARGMTNKTVAFDLPVGGAKGGIDFDPKDPRAKGVLTRFCDAMRPYLDNHWVTAEDLGVSQQSIDEVFAGLGMRQSFHAAIERSATPAATAERVAAGLNASAPGGLLGDVIGGYGVAQAALAAARVRDWTLGETEIAVQGVGTMGGAAAYYLHEAGAKVVALADATGTLYDPSGLEVPALLESRNRFGEIDRGIVGPGVQVLEREAVLGLSCDVLIPAAVSYALTLDNCEDVRASIVVEAANAATTPDAELSLAARGVAVLPDFIANAGAVAWAWWLLLGDVGEDYRDSFGRLAAVMRSKVTSLLTEWNPAEGPVRWAAEVDTRVDAGESLVIP
ncbi:Glu/Leu/Phe/Val family dehydrogenase [Gordonia caeni]